MGIFTFEAIIKLIAMKKAYFSDSWNIFDFVIVFFTLIVLFLKLIGVNLGIGSLGLIMRALRIGRILRLLKRMKGL